MSSRVEQLSIHPSKVPVTDFVRVTVKDLAFVPEILGLFAAFHYEGILEVFIPRSLETDWLFPVSSREGLNVSSTAGVVLKYRFSSIEIVPSGGVPIDLVENFTSWLDQNDEE